MVHAITEPPERKSSHSFECSNCGATLVYGADSEKLECEYCESVHELSESEETEEVAITEQALGELFSSSKKQVITENRILECEQCGACTTLEGRKTTSTCPFCASEMVKEREAEEQLVPTGLVPFSINQEKASRVHRAWLKTLWLRPNDLTRMSKVAEIEGVYTPFWTFDAEALSRWRAESGEYYYETETYKDENGRRATRQVQRTNWSSAKGHRAGTYDDVLVCGSRGLSADLVRRLEPFHTITELEPYNPEYLAGWQAEEYGLGPEVAWRMAKGLMEEKEYNACGSEVPGDTYRGLQVSTRLSSATGKYVLLPIWVAAYRYKGKSYRFLVNGETGEISGEAPYSLWKQAMLAILCVFVLFTIITSAGAALIPWGFVALLWTAFAYAKGWFKKPEDVLKE
jgi:ferredoxin